MLKVVLVGRPNVGKSTLFNRLVRSQKAIVNDQPGVTRDRKYGNGKLADLEFTLIDTAGIDDSLKGSTEIKIKEQCQLAIDDADVIFFVIDGREGVLPIEKSFAMSLKKKNKPIKRCMMLPCSPHRLARFINPNLRVFRRLCVTLTHGRGLPCTPRGTGEYTGIRTPMMREWTFDERRKKKKKKVGHRSGPVCVRVKK